MDEIQVRMCFFHDSLYSKDIEGDPEVKETVEHIFSKMEVNVLINRTKISGRNWKGV